MKKPIPYFLSGESEMAKLTREFDWSNTSLGPIENWPATLCTTLDILLNSRFPMFLFWGEDYICFYNDAYRPSLGIKGKHHNILVMKGIEAWTGIWEEINPLLDQVMSGGGATWSENQLIPFYRNGLIEDIYWTFSYSPIKNPEGKIIGVLTVCHETTETVKAQNALETNEERFRSMSEDTDLYIVLGDKKGEATYFNPAWTKLTGSPLKDLVGKGWAEYVHPEDKEPYSKLYFDAFEKQSAFKGEFRIRDQNGSYRWLWANATPRFYANGEFSGYIGTLTDYNRT